MNGRHPHPPGDPAPPPPPPPKRERSATPPLPTYNHRASSNVPPPQRLRRDRLLELLRGTPGSLTATQLAELMSPREEHLYPYGMCCDDLRELERYGLVRFYSSVPKLWEAVPTHFSELESDIRQRAPDIRPELDTQDDDDVWRRRENVKRVLAIRGVRLHDDVIAAIVQAACDPTLRAV